MKPCEVTWKIDWLTYLQTNRLMWLMSCCRHDFDDFRELWMIGSWTYHCICGYCTEPTLIVSPVTENVFGWRSRCLVSTLQNFLTSFMLHACLVSYLQDFISATASLIDVVWCVQAVLDCCNFMARKCHIVLLVQFNTVTHVNNSVSATFTFFCLRLFRTTKYLKALCL